MAVKEPQGIGGRSKCKRTSYHHVWSQDTDCWYANPGLCDSIRGS